MQLVIFLVIVLLGVLLVSSAYVFSAACLRRKELPWLVEEEITKTPYGKYYQSMADADRWFRDKEAEDVYIKSTDGLLLHGLWVESPNAKGTVILAHGYRSTMLLDFGVASAYYFELGFNVLVPDQRSHGKSEGRYITFGVKESDDFLHWIEFHNHKYPDLPVILIGMSMGASTVLYLADKMLPKNVKGIIGDCGFTSPKDIISIVFRKVAHFPPDLIIFFTNLWTRLFAGFALGEMDTRKVLANSRIPVLLIHGRADNFVPCWMSEAAFEVCASYKEILLIDGAKHGVSFLKAPEQYTEAVVRFINYLLRDRGERDETY